MLSTSSRKKKKVRRTRTKIYIKTEPEKNMIINMGIEFSEFFRYLPVPFENLLLLRGDCSGYKYIHNFEVLEGLDSILKLTEEDFYNFGDFCFVDCADADAVQKLSGQQAAELLYLAHKVEPLASPFFEELQNRFVYFAHDDGFYCRLYCREPLDFINVISSKIMEYVKEELHYKVCTVSMDVKHKMLQITKNGLFIDLDEITFGDEGAVLKLYEIGEFQDMDAILNNLDKVKSAALQIHLLNCGETQWKIT